MNDTLYIGWYARKQAAIRANIERLEREHPTPQMTDEQWHIYLQNRARIAELEARRNPPNE